MFWGVFSREKEQISNESEFGAVNILNSRRITDTLLQARKRAIQTSYLIILTKPLHLHHVPESHRSETKLKAPDGLISPVYNENVYSFRTHFRLCTIKLLNIMLSL